MFENITYVALDDHKRRHQVAVLLPGMKREDASTWRVENTRAGIRKMVRKVMKMAPGDVRFCYEAGPNGYVLQRQISEFDRVSCVVVAPSKTPRRPGERVKTDRRDARKLVSLFRSGELQSIVASKGATEIYACSTSRPRTPSARVFQSRFATPN